MAKRENVRNSRRAAADMDKLQVSAEVASGIGPNISRSAPHTLQLEGRHPVPIRCQAHQSEQIPKIPAVTGRHQAAILSGKETINKE